MTTDQLALFDYVTLDPESRSLVQERTAEIRSLMRRTAENIRTIGIKLAEVKRQLGHGRFLDWLDAEFQWSERTARSFMAVAERFISANFADSSIAPSALYLLAAPSTPDEARQEALDRAGQGEHITHAKAQEIVQEHKGNGAWWDEQRRQAAIISEHERGPLPKAPFPIHSMRSPESEAQLSDYEFNRQQIMEANRQGAAIDVPPPEPAAPMIIHPPTVEEIAGPVRPAMAVHFSSATPEHYTPRHILDAVEVCLGGIDLDPCAESHDSPNVPACHHFTVQDDGLAQEWQGRVFMNPPYGSEIVAWVEKLCKEHEEGRTTEAIALVPARTDTGWWQRMRDYVVCLVDGRLTFGGNNSPAPFPSAIFYLGEDTGLFYRTFQGIGDIWQRLEPDNDGVVWPGRFAE